MKLNNRKKTNIIIILADDMGFSDIGCYGSEIDTPYLNEMAKNGVVCSQMYNNARCCPSRASILTGLYPHKTGIGHMVDYLDIPGYEGYINNKCVTIAEVLKANGYRTAMSGKWHVGGTYHLDGSVRDEHQLHPTPLTRGFERFYGTLEGASSYFNPHTLYDQNKAISVSAGQDFYYTDAISDHAVGMIEEFSSLDDPFFLYVAYTAPHWPLQAREKDIEKYKDTYDGGWDQLRVKRYKRLIEQGIIQDQWDLSARDENSYPWQDADNKEWESMRMAVYAAQIDRMDQGIGRIRRTLQELNIENDTLIMFMSDNGGCAELLQENGWLEEYVPFTRNGNHIIPGNRPDRMPGGEDTYMSYDLPWANASNTPFRYFKHWVHEGGISTPFICYWPDKIAPCENIIHIPMHFIDIMATCIDVAEVKYPQQYHGVPIKPLDGESVLPALLGKRWERNRPIFWEHEGNLAVRFQRYKLVKKFRCAWELYDMETDRTEQHDLAPANKDIVNQLEQLYLEWAHKTGVVDFHVVQGTN